MKLVERISDQSNRPLSTRTAFPTSVTAAALPIVIDPLRISAALGDATTMVGKLLASRLAERLRLPFAAVGGLSAGMAIANLASLIPDNVTMVAALLVAAPGMGLFFCEVFDGRFHNALSALNDRRRQQARALGWTGRLFGFGLPVGDRLLFAVGLLAFATVVAAGSWAHKMPPSVLALAGFWLVGVTQIALMVRGHPNDQFIPYF